MKQEKQWDLLRLFGEEVEGETALPSDPTPQTTQETGEQMIASAPAAEETTTAKTRQEEFRTLMEGEYKDLFTAYFQETFNRRFREQKGMQEELLQARELIASAAEYFGVSREELPKAIRAECEKRNAPTVAKGEEPARAEFQAELERAVAAAVESTRADTERAVLAAVRARSMRPAEAALSAGHGRALRSDAAHLSREQRAEVARRAARGEQIKF